MFLRKLVSALLASTALAATALAAEPSVAAQCRTDLDEIAAFLPVNDSGGADALAHHGAAIEAALGQARAQTASVADAAACDAILAAYLRAWRPGHLSVTAAAPAAAAGRTRADDPASRLPSLKILGPDTLLLVLPSFKDSVGAPLAALLDRHRAALESHPYWIVDVRGNGGGSDTSYGPLLPWLLDGDYLDYRFEYLATPATIQAQEKICAMQAEPEPCRRQLGPVIEAMKAARPGSFVMRDGERLVTERPPAREPKAPRRVAVLADRACGSSCDEFLLTVKSSFRVKLVGRPSAGVIDYSNLRPHMLPSGRMLKYATTRSTRAATLPLDGIGVAPDILLPEPPDAAGREAEVARVRRWLETGQLSASGSDRVQ